MNFLSLCKKFIGGPSFSSAWGLICFGAWIGLYGVEGQVTAQSLETRVVVQGGGEGPRLEELHFPDPQLALCVERWAKSDINLYRFASDVRELSCSRYGIRRLEGIDQLTELKAIDLSQNPVESYRPLYFLAKELGFLWIWGNVLPCDVIPELRQNLQQTWIGGLQVEKCTPRTSEGEPESLPPTPLPKDQKAPSLPTDSSNDAETSPEPTLPPLPTLPPSEPKEPRQPRFPQPPSIPVPVPPEDVPQGNENLSGKEVYLKECAVCHGQEGEGNERGYPIRFPVESYAEAVTRQGRSGNSSFPIPMPGYSKEQISDVQLREMWSYLRSFPRPQTGKQLFETYCANCHGADGRGGFSGKDVVRETDDYREAIREGEHQRDYLNRKKYMPAYSPLEISLEEITLLRLYARELRQIPHPTPHPIPSDGDEDEDEDEDEHEHVHEHK